MNEDTDTSNNSNNESTIYLQVGPTSNLVSAHSWNIRANNQLSNLSCDSYHKIWKDETTTSFPRTVVIDFDENMPSFNLDSSTGDFDKDAWSSIWTGPISTYNLVSSSSNASNGEFSNRSNRSSTSLNGMNVLEAELHRNSTIALPVWTTPDRFDSYHKGLHESACGEVPFSYVESVTDKVRYFAEAVDQLSAISVMSDLQGGFGGLCSSLLSEIRDDFGNHVMIPVWGMSDSLQSTSNDLDTLDETDMKHQLQRLDRPLCYGGIVEHSNLFLPLSANRQCIQNFFGIPTAANVVHEISLSYIALAAVLECANYASYGSATGGVVEWCAKVSGAGRWPVGLLEGFLCSDRSASMMRRNIQAICERYTCFNSDEHREHTSSNVVVQSNSDMRSLNPFMESFTSILLGTKRTTSDSIYLKPYTNLLHVRSGDDSTGLARYLFERSSNSSFYITGCRQTLEPISIPYKMSSFVSGIPGSERAGSRDTGHGDSMVLSGVGAVGTSARVGDHLKAVAAGFSTRSPRVQVQLNKVGMDHEDCLELQESLLSLANRYNV